MRITIIKYFFVSVFLCYLQSASADAGSNQTDLTNPYGGALFFPKVADIIMFHPKTVACSSEADLSAIAIHLVTKEYGIAALMLNNKICGFITATNQQYKVLSIDKISEKLVLVQFVNARDVNASTGYWTINASIKAIIP